MANLGGPVAKNLSESERDGLVTAAGAAPGDCIFFAAGLRGVAQSLLGATRLEIGRRLGVPRRPLAIIEGESLVNDGTALVLFKFAVAAVVTGTFSLLHASLLFVWTVLGGIAIGLVVGLVIGGPLGCLLGLPAAIIGCLPGAIIGALTFASIGSIAGLGLGGGGGAIVAVQKYLDTINKPFKPGDGQSKPKAKPKKNGTR